MPPKVGAGLRFGTVAGTIPRLDVPTTPFGAAVVPGDITFGLWVWVDRLVPAQVLLSTPSGSYAEVNAQVENNGAITATRGNDGTGAQHFVTTPAVPTGRWVRLLLAFPASSAAVVYFDGAAQAITDTGVFSRAVGAGSGTMRVGNSAAGTAVLMGKVAGLRVWSRILTADEALRDAAGVDVLAGAVLDLPLDEGVGVKALDRSPVPLADGTLTGGAQWVQPKAERGMRGVRGTSQAVTVPGGRDWVEQAAASSTILAWARMDDLPPNATNYPSLFGVSSGANDFSYRVDNPPGGTGTFGIGGFAPNTFGIVHPFADLRWHHVAIVDEFLGGTSHRFSQIVDGALATAPTTAAITGALAAAGASLVIGEASGGSGRSWPGPIRDFAVFSRALTTTEIRAVMLGVVKPTDLAGCVLWLPLEGDTLNRAAVGTRKRNRIAQDNTAAVELTADGPSGWTQGGGPAAAWATATERALEGPRSLKVVAGSAGLFTMGASGPVEPGKTYTLRIRMLAGPNNTGDNTVDLSAQNLTAAGGFIGQVGPGASATLKSDAWTTLDYTLTTPSTGGRLVLYPRFLNPQAGDVFYIASKATIVEGTVGASVGSTIGEPTPAVHGREAGTPRLVRPRARGGLRVRNSDLMSGNGDVVDSPSLAAFALPAFTLSIWYRPDLMPAAGGQGLIALGNADGSKNVNIASAGGDLRSSMVASSVGGVLPSGGGPRLAALTYDGATARLFLDGVERLTTATVFVPTTAQWVRMGSWYATGRMNVVGGILSDARLFSRALSADEVAGLVVGQVPREALEGEWLTEGSIMGAVALDTSGKGRHGTILGGAVAA